MGSKPSTPKYDVQYQTTDYIPTQYNAIAPQTAQYTPSAMQLPEYNTTAALDEQNRINSAYGYQKYANMNSPLGGYRVDIDPATGQMTVNKYLSDASQSAQTAQGNALSRFVANPQDAMRDYYNSQMEYVQPTFDAQIDAAKESMANRGIKMGSKTWNDTLAGIESAQDKSRTAMLNNALFNGQNYQSNLLGQAQIAGNQIIDPNMVEGTGGAGLSNIYANQYNALLNQAQANYDNALLRYNNDSQYANNAYQNAINAYNAELTDNQGQYAANLSNAQGNYQNELNRYDNAVKRYQTAMAGSNKWGNILGTVGGIAGGVVGGIFGGPGGAVMGAQAGTAGGSGIGGIIDA